MQMKKLNKEIVAAVPDNCGTSVPDTFVTDSVYSLSTIPLINKGAQDILYCV